MTSCEVNPVTSSLFNGLDYLWTGKVDVPYSRSDFYSSESSTRPFCVERLWTQV